MPRTPEPILAEGQVLFEMGRLDDAERLFASLLHFRRTDVHDQPPSVLARQRTWALTHVAAARAAAGDTGSLAALADSIEAIGGQSLFGRDNRLHHHARGLLLAARGQTAEAADAFRRAIHSRTAAYTRTNLELATVILALNRPLDAVDILQPAFRGSLEASNFYVTHTELHAALGRAWDAAGRTDSAAVHYRWVVQALRSADPPFHARRDSVRARLLAIERGNAD
jgi:predicted Zn-dependent protease